GYRSSASKPGHHQTAIQSLGLTMGVEQPDIIVLDALRRQRNASDYEGDPVSTSTLQACIDQAGHLLAHTTQWLHVHRPDLAGPAA
ncbi:MAG: DNA-binding protein, partial [Burkholderiaceae bacterium]|nr:DNA-binding protein [Burkholderiaceae bacterium]